MGAHVSMSIFIALGAYLVYWMLIIPIPRVKIEVGGVNVAHIIGRFYVRVCMLHVRCILYSLDQMPTLLFISSHKFVRLQLKSGDYLREVFTVNIRA